MVQVSKEVVECRHAQTKTGAGCGRLKVLAMRIRHSSHSSDMVLFGMSASDFLTPSIFLSLHTGSLLNINSFQDQRSIQWLKSNPPPRRDPRSNVVL